ncbi:MAG: dihydrodipicolinate synthase family protein [Acidobacteria bacterium]|nr:dihydrodipicolinate synthase family protein [Acidobacteriota bacterium]MBI3424577.1 dihydrodipicolinate synthase family protein [Acidobacteriota bacterium]
MKTSPVTPADLRGVFPVPPLARAKTAQRPLDFAENEKIVRHIAKGGLTRFLYGGNAFLYHITLAEYTQLLEWMASFSEDWWMIPSLGPSYGRAMDQAALLRNHSFPCAMMLPCADPRDAAGLERGLREITDAAGMPLILYLKEENNFGANKEAGLDVVAKLVDEGLCCWIKYAVVRQDPTEDAYLDALLRRVDRARIVSGIGERPAIVHTRDFGLPGFTTGSGCVAPRLTQKLFEACAHNDWETAESIRAQFIAHEDLRDAWGPAKVLHSSMALTGIAASGPVPPFISPLSAAQDKELVPVARALHKANG